MGEFDEMNRKVIAEFHENAGVVGGWFEGQDIVLLHTTGAKSGKTRVNPLVALPDGDRVVVIASAGGQPAHPDWYRNLTANPEVTVEQGTETWKGRATEVTGAERDRLYAGMVGRMAQFADYETKTEGIRTIPVIALERI